MGITKIQTNPKSMNRLAIILSILLLSCVLKSTVAKKSKRLLLAKNLKSLGDTRTINGVHQDVLHSHATHRRVPTPDYPETNLHDAAIAYDGQKYARLLKKYIGWTNGTDTHFKPHFSKDKPTNPF